LWDVGAGNPGLGTSGSGDVLAGAVAGFLARKATPAQAACWATYLHATAGDRLAATIGPISFLARELLDAMPRVLAELST
ncbi:MAG: NAD(P)H-hydrate dehydratase, partial [Actinomycetota bacterium]|nr:NAD(P)H-hydrate dehydratase [Actinomycetota bacterium]